MIGQGAEVFIPPAIGENPRTYRANGKALAPQTTMPVEEGIAKQLCALEVRVAEVQENTTRILRIIEKLGQATPKP